LTGANAIDIVHSEYSIYSPIHYKKCGELNYLTPDAFWNITDFGAKCEKFVDDKYDNTGKWRT
jgi:hypothetical protein